MDISLFVMLGLGLLVLFSFFVAYLSARTWYVSHVLIVVGVFMASVAFFILAPATLQTQAEWRGLYSQLSASLKAEMAKTDELLHGDPNAAEPSLESLPGLRGALERAVLDRGRVWRNVQFQGARNNEIVLDMSQFGDANCVRLGLEQEDDFDLEPEPDPNAQATARQHGITENMILSAFQESSLVDLGQGPQGESLLNALLPGSELPMKDTQGVCRLPAYYMGEFEVSGVTDESITVTPTFVLTPDQINRINAAPGTTWSLYEIMPIDKHDIFAGVTAENMRVILSEAATGRSGEAYAALIDEYVRDNKEALPGDVEERTWTRVKFLKPYSMDVDAEGGDAGPLGMVERNFDTSGLAVSPLLRQGSPTEFAPDTIALLDAESARKLIEQEFCEPEGSQAIYRRPLRDYEFFYHDLALRFQDLADDSAIVQRQTLAVSEAKKEADREILYREGEKQRLAEDLSRFSAELDEVIKLRTDLQNQNAQRRSTLSQVYRENNRLAAELSRLQSQLQGLLLGRDG